MSDLPVDVHLQTAYQRWEMAPLGATRPARTGAGHLPTTRLTQEVARAREAGHQLGYQEGLQQGHSQGQADGLALGLMEGQRLMETEQAALQALIESFQKQVTHAREHVAQQVLALALDMAHAVLKSALAVQPERVLPLIEQTLQSLPTLKSNARLFLHPQDLALLEAAQGAALTAAGWQLRADPDMLRGGCRLETPANEIDATLPTRWSRLQQALGQQGDWLLPL